MFSSDCDFFFFKQKTAYEMRISDWSSDVCSSDLPEVHEHHAETRLHPEPRTLGVAQESDGGTDRAEVRRHRASERGARAGAPLRVHFRLAEDRKSVE